MVGPRRVEQPFLEWNRDLRKGGPAKPLDTPILAQRHSAAVRAPTRRLLGAIPPLRPDIEFRERLDGTVELRDPHLLQILTVHADDFAVARAFDGRLDAKAIRLLRGQSRDWPVRRIESIAREFEGLHLLDTPAARKAE